MKLTPIEYIGADPVRKKRRSPLGGWLLFAFALITGGIFVRPLFVSAQSAIPTDANVTHAVKNLEASGAFHDLLAAEALKRTLVDIEYDTSYYSIDFPMGDIPEGRGKEVDVVIRSYRELDVDLQTLVHRDISENFRAYPQLFDSKEPDPNIDHRRVPNLQRFFTRTGEILASTHDANDYSFGDIVVWRLVHGKAHMGIVSLATQGNLHLLGWFCVMG